MAFFSLFGRAKACSILLPNAIQPAQYSRVMGRRAKAPSSSIAVMGCMWVPYLLQSAHASAVLKRIVALSGCAGFLIACSISSGGTRSCPSTHGLKVYVGMGVCSLVMMVHSRSRTVCVSNSKPCKSGSPCPLDTACVAWWAVLNVTQYSPAPTL